VIRDILVFLEPTIAGRRRLRLAMNIALEHRACLSAVLLQRKDYRRLSCFGGGGQLSVEDLDFLDLFCIPETPAHAFRDYISNFAIEGDCFPLDPANTPALINAAKVADLIIVGQVDRDARPSPPWRAQEIVLACGRPVLMVPYAGSFERVGRRVLVAWDGSREAVKALNDAIPLIRAAENVIILTVRGRDRDFAADRPLMRRIINHLARHGIAAEAYEVQHYGNPISGVVLSKTVDLASDMIVAGAFHHSQLRETFLGGVSRGLFEEMTVPVLMAH
jgi:nucleotide-binding universal stress UspA family protein